MLLVVAPTAFSHLTNCYLISLSFVIKGFTPAVGPMCMDSLGMETNKIPDSDITASSWDSTFKPAFARFAICKCLWNLICLFHEKRHGMLPHQHRTKLQRVLN